MLSFNSNSSVKKPDPAVRKFAVGCLFIPVGLGAAVVIITTFAAAFSLLFLDSPGSKPADIFSVYLPGILISLIVGPGIWVPSYILFRTHFYFASIVIALAGPVAVYSGLPYLLHLHLH